MTGGNRARPRPERPGARSSRAWVLSQLPYGCHSEQSEESVLPNCRSLTAFGRTGNLMPELSLTRENHGDSMFVGRRDDLRIAHRAARLHDGPHAGLGGLVDPVAEGEE